MDSGHWVAEGGQCETASGFIHPSSFILYPSSFRPLYGFTLIELLVTIAIIGIITGMSLGALRYARTVAAEDKTKATIAKLNDIIMRRYESYMTRRLPIDTSKILDPNDAKTTQGLAQIRLDLLRDLMRMEMPDRWSDVYNDPYVYNHVRLKKDITTYNAQYSIPVSSQPALKRAYQERYSQAVSHLVNPPINMPIDDAKAKVEKNGGPECLYMIVSMGDPEAMEQFSQNEIGDVDGDGLLEFIDGWGTPISFLRWAPGFNDSDVQANIDTSWNSDTPPPNPPALEQRRLATTNDHDPFDPQRVDLGQPEDPNNPNSRKVPTGWRLVPLIYSFGPDKKEGIYSASDFTYHGNPYETISGGGNPVGIGTPMSTKEHIDNIHNHRIEQK